MDTLLQTVFAFSAVGLTIAGVWFVVAMAEDAFNMFMLCLAVCCTVVCILLTFLFFTVTVVSVFFIVPALFFVFCAVHYYREMS